MGVNDLILADATLKGSKKGKDVFEDYARRVTGDATKEAVAIKSIPRKGNQK